MNNILPRQYALLYHREERNWKLVRRGKDKVAGSTAGPGDDLLATFYDGDEQTPSPLGLHLVHHLINSEEI